MQLTTTWFGTFLHKNNGSITKYLLFPKDPTQIAQRLQQIQNNCILTEEQKVAKEVTPTVFEKRLQHIGTYTPESPNQLRIHPEDYEVSYHLLQQALQYLVEKQVKTQLSSPDLTIIQMVNALDDLIQTQNLFAERLQAWSVLTSKTPDKKKGFQELTKKVQTQILQLEKQIDEEMNQIAPNISSIAGSLVGARLIALAGGLQQLALLPASTVQLLGAEKALFRFKKEGGRPPKHGVIFQHAQIYRLPRSQRGKRARILATIISTAAKADAFTKRNITDYLDKQLCSRLQSSHK